jgi:hypothetical protein
MPRPNITSEYILALEKPYLYPAIFVSVTFASGTINIWNGYGEAILQSVVYTGVGSLLQISTIEDGSSVEARGVTVSLSGIDPTLLPAALDDYQVGLPATIYLGLFGGRGLLLVNEPLIAWQGRTDQPTITSGPTTATISLNLESVLMDLNTPIPWRYTQVDQNIFYPGDPGFMWVNSIQSIVINWNQQSNSDGNP